MVAKVAVARAVYAIDKPYDYLVPGELEPRLRPGMRVLVPFGSGKPGSDGLVLALRGGSGRSGGTQAHHRRPGPGAGAGRDGHPAGPLDAGAVFLHRL